MSKISLPGVEEMQIYSLPLGMRNVIERDINQLEDDIRSTIERFGVKGYRICVEFESDLFLDAKKGQLIKGFESVVPSHIYFDAETDRQSVLGERAKW